MSSDAYCLIGVTLTLVTFVAIFMLLRGMPRPGVFRSWKAILRAARESRTLFEKSLLVVVLIAQMCRGGAYTLAAALVAAAASIGTAICGINPENMRIARDILNDVLQWLRPESHTSSIPTHH
jgi:hypothetical protein